LSEFIDYDNDGLLDLLIVQSGKLHLWRSIGDKWVDVTDHVFSRSSQILLQPRSLASVDIDNDGDIDLIFISASANRLQISSNLADDRNHSVKLQLNATVSNRSSVQAKIEMRAGSLIHKQEVYAASPAPAASDIRFGIGPRTAADAIRVIWPAGIIQTEMQPETQTETEVVKQIPQSQSTANSSSRTSIKITELDRKPSSCPFLFAWDGEKFGFVTDFQSSGEISAWLSPGVYSLPDPDEYVRIRDDQMKDHNGRFDLRMTYELEEAYYVDRVQLIAVDHPRGTEVFPNEGMRDPPPSFKLFMPRNLRSPVTALDSAGRDTLAQIKYLDRKFVEFPLHSIRGFAEPHTLTLDLGKTETDRIVLFLTGWMDYIFSSDNVAASQSSIKQIPPALQVKDARGRWRTVIKNIGLPIGHPQTVTVDLTGKFLSRSREVRIITNLRLFWDQIQWDQIQRHQIRIATSNNSSPIRITRLEPVTADLHWRGYSTEATPDGRAPYLYDYSRVTEQSPWKVLPGSYTREGDVLALLLKTDDLLAVTRTGDEISLSFDATRLGPLKDGWKRTFLFYSDGFSKEMDINSGSPDQLSPLPFHKMTEYPFRRRSARAIEVEARRRDYTKKYNTRLVTRRIPQLLFTKS
ncbi:MAG: FG-GAP repeat domain-containing protein, partial [Pyrinomonadaceae bacterium]